MAAPFFLEAILWLCLARPQTDAILLMARTASFTSYAPCSCRFLSTIAVVDDHFKSFTKSYKEYSAMTSIGGMNDGKKDV